jgi:CBS domain-containing protein
VPVVDNERRVIGMITDRDICIATATRSANSVRGTGSRGDVRGGFIPAHLPMTFAQRSER